MKRRLIFSLFQQTNMPRTIALGDIHGCSDALAAVLSAIYPRSEDTIICLGDYVDD